MMIRNMVLTALCSLVVLGTAAPALGDDGWRRHDRWREHAWREHERREQAWREHEWRRQEWRERYRPPGVRAPAYGYYDPPRSYYGNPRYYR